MLHLQLGSHSACGRPWYKARAVEKERMNEYNIWVTNVLWCSSWSWCSQPSPNPIPGPSPTRYKHMTYILLCIRGTNEEGVTGKHRNMLNVEWPWWRKQLTSSQFSLSTVQPGCDDIHCKCKTFSFFPNLSLLLSHDKVRHHYDTPFIALIRLLFTQCSFRDWTRQCY